jgi:hypothetical protein
MIEVCKVPCSVRGCDLSTGRVVRDGEHLELETFKGRHHGRHYGRADLYSLFAKLRREGLDKDTQRES